MANDALQSVLGEFMRTVRETVVTLKDEVRAVKSDNERLTGEITALRAAHAEVRSFQPDDVRPMLEAMVREIELPPGPKGEPGEPGTPGADGRDGDPGKDGADGKDGRDGADGNDGAPGEAGADGAATREEIEAIVEQRFADVMVRSFADLHRGTFKPGYEYGRSDVVAWDGCTWLALRATEGKPGTDDSWRLIAKKGRDGRNRP